jgi:tetratricopeptide (TPR) repeat protein
VVRPYSLEAFERQLRLAVSASMVPGSRQNMHARAGELSTGAHDRRVAGRSRAPRTPREMFAQGRRLLSSRDLDGAAAMFAQAVRGARTYPEACHGLAQAHARKGDKQAWGFWLRKAVMQYAFQDRFHEVRNLYDKVRAAGLGMRNPFYSVALIHYRRQDHDEAMLALRRALKLTPGDERALLLVSNIHLAQGRLVGAIDFLEGQLEKHGTPRVRAMYDALTADPDAVAAPPRMADRIERTLGSIREKIENMMPERMGRMLPARIPGHPGCSEGM